MEECINSTENAQDSTTKMEIKSENIIENNISNILPQNFLAVNNDFTKLAWCQTILGIYGQIMRFNVLRTLAGFANNL